MLSVKKFRQYVEGYHFKIITEHASLKWLMSQNDLSGRPARWSLKLQSLDFEIEHQPGSQNIVTDTLSRILVHYDNLQKFKNALMLHAFVYDKRNPVDVELDFEDEDYVSLKHRINSNSEN